MSLVGLSSSIGIAFQGFWFVAALSVGNFIYRFSTPIDIVMGQETMPERENVAYSLMMGTAWGMAGLLALPIGAIANVVGLGATLTGLAPLSMGSSLLGIPRRREGERVPATPVAEQV